MARMFTENVKTRFSPREAARGDFGNILRELNSSTGLKLKLSSHVENAAELRDPKKRPVPSNVKEYTDTRLIRMGTVGFGGRNVGLVSISTKPGMKLDKHVSVIFYPGFEHLTRAARPLESGLSPFFRDVRVGTGKADYSNQFARRMRWLP